MRRALAFLCLIALAACGGELPESDALFRLSDESGSIRIRLLGSDAEGHHYKLRNATFEVSGAAMVTLSTSGQDPRLPSLSTPLPSGTYQLFLRPGYEVIELVDDGSEQLIAARLSSPRPVPVHVVQRGDQQVALRFLQGQHEITFGSITPATMAQRQGQASVLARAP